MSKVEHCQEKNAVRKRLDTGDMQTLYVTEDKLIMEFRLVYPVFDERKRSCIICV